MKKILLVVALTLVILLSDFICLNLLSRYDGERNVAEALEEQHIDEEPGIYYDTLFNELNPKQLLTYNNGIFIATDDSVFEYKIEDRTWVDLKVTKPIEETMGTLKGLNYSALKDGLSIKDYKKVVSDINNDGKLVYELNKTNEGNFIWDKIIENGKFCKDVEGNVEQYKITSFYNESINERKVKTDKAEYYITGNNLYVHEKDKNPQLIKTYKDTLGKISITKFGKEIFVYGGSFGVERIVSSKQFKGEEYFTYTLGDFKLSLGSIVSYIVSPDEGHTLFILDSENKVYKLLLANTWISHNVDAPISNEMYCSLGEAEKVKELTVGSKVFKIVKSEEWGKSYITVNDKILKDTIRDSFQYPDEITRFSSVDDSIYFWSKISQPIRVNINDESVEFMGQGNLFNNNNLNEKIVKDSNGNIYLEKSDKKTYKYLEKNKFYDSGLPYKVSDIKIMNDQCYAISSEGLYLFNAKGQWEILTDSDISPNCEEKLIVLGNSLYALAEGSLYKLNENNKWDLVESKINKGLTSIYYINKDENKVYFVAEEDGESHVSIIDFVQNKWSKTKTLPDIKNINSVAAEGVNIYVGTQYIADGAAYVYKNCKWISVLPQLEIENHGTIKNSLLVKDNNGVYFQVSEKEKEEYGIWQLKDGNAIKVEDVKEQDKLIPRFNKDEVLNIYNMGISFELKNGRVMRKVM